MHVVMFGDQHVESLGGAQVSMRLQRRFLEKAGHTVTIVAPAMHGARGRAVAPEPSYLDMPSIPITLDREYSFTWPGRRADRWVDAALATRPPVDVVHVQADFWGAFIGHRFAARHGLPVVHTMHNRVDVGIEATAPFPGLVLRVLNAWQRRALGSARGGSGRLVVSAAVRREIGCRHRPVVALRAAARSARGRAGWAARPPRRRPARRRHLERHRRRGAGGGARFDRLSDRAAGATRSRAPGLPRFVWIGRMSPEKRLLPFLEALAESGVRAEVEVIGGGGQLRAARRIVEKRRPAASVVFSGPLPYAEVVRRIQAADAVVQTSIGFETQGMTLFEAASLGTPSVVSDPDIAAELGSGFWSVSADGEADASTAALAAALRRAAADIEAGTAPVPDPSIRERFRQSSRTAAMIEVYRRVTGA